VRALARRVGASRADRLRSPSGGIPALPKADRQRRPPPITAIRARDQHQGSAPQPTPNSAFGVQSNGAHAWRMCTLAVVLWRSGAGRSASAPALVPAVGLGEDACRVTGHPGHWYASHVRWPALDPAVRWPRRRDMTWLAARGGA
jgi:hypothetical protein